MSAILLPVNVGVDLITRKLGTPVTRTTNTSVWRAIYYILLTNDLGLVGIAQNLLDPRSSWFDFFWIEPIILDVPRHGVSARMT